MASGQRLANLLINANQQAVTNFAVPDDLANGHLVLDFDATTQKYAVWQFPALANYSGNGMTVNLLCAMDTGALGAVILSVAIEKQGTSDLAGTDSFATAINSATTTVPSTAKQYFTVPISLSNSQIDGIANGDPFRVRVSRLPSSLGNTAAGDLMLITGWINET
jgi:hypothetical protein